MSGNALSIWRIYIQHHQAKYCSGLFPDGFSYQKQLKSLKVSSSCYKKTVSLFPNFHPYHKKINSLF